MNNGMEHAIDVITSLFNYNNANICSVRIIIIIVKGTDIFFVS